MLNASLLAVTLLSSGLPAASIAPTIVNGNNASISTYPYMASLFYDRRHDLNFYGNYCGASILDSWHVLTAAHCVQDYTYNNNTLVVLKMEQDSDFESSEKIKAKEFYWRDDYIDSGSALWVNDIAIIKLESEMQTINSSSFVPLPQSGDDSNYRINNAQFVAIGHGNTASGVDNSTHLLQVTLDYVQPATCSSFGPVGSGHLCVEGTLIGSLKGGPCQGDSGGPLVWFDGNVFRQVGIASFGPSLCGDPSAPAQGVFTEVLDYTAWIQSVIAGNEVPKHTVGSSSGSGGGDVTVADGAGSSLSFGGLGLLVLLMLRRKKSAQ